MREKGIEGDNKEKGPTPRERERERKGESEKERERESWRESQRRYTPCDCRIGGMKEESSERGREK